MISKFLTLVFCFGIYNTTSYATDAVASEDEIVVCQDQAENFGNGKGDDFISDKCKDNFKKMATPFATKESKIPKIKFFGYRNMLLIEKTTGKSIITEVIAGGSTELKTIKALTIDEKNKEIVVLEDSGDVLFFTYKISGNIAPYRILRHKDLVGASELVIDILKDQVIVNNKKSGRLLFFSRLANVNGNLGKQKLDVVKAIDCSLMDLSDLSIDPVKSELSGFDNTKMQNVFFSLK